MTRVAWTFVDSPDVSLEVNPSEDVGTLAVRKAIQYENTAGPDGKTLIYDGGEENPKASFAGVIYTQAQYNVLVAEVEKDLSQLTDDRGVQFDIVWNSYTLKRADNYKYPWRHEYNLEGTVVDYTIPA